MSTTYLLVLLVVVVAVLAVRVLAPALPLRPVRTAPLDVVLTAVGLLGLAFHCGSMFYRRTVLNLPGTTTIVHHIDALGTTSMIAFAIPAALVLIGLRRVPPLALAVLTLALATVGITMYDHGSLTAHTSAIFAAVVAIAAVAAGFVGTRRTA